MLTWLKALIHGDRGILRQDSLGELVVSKQARPRTLLLRNPADNSTVDVSFARPAANWSVQLWHAAPPGDIVVTLKARNAVQSNTAPAGGSTSSTDFTGDSSTGTILNSIVPWDTVTTVTISIANPVQTIEVDTTLAAYSISVAGLGAGGVGAIASY